jgi:hypothetical protein
MTKQQSTMLQHLDPALVSNAVDGLRLESDRGVILVAGAIVDTILADRLDRVIRHGDSKARGRLLTRSSFSVKLIRKLTRPPAGFLLSLITHARPAKCPRRHPGFSFERTSEVRLITESVGKCDIRQRVASLPKCFRDHLKTYGPKPSHWRIVETQSKCSSERPG